MRFLHLVIHIALEVKLTEPQRLSGPTILKIGGIALTATECSLGERLIFIISVMIDVEVTSKNNQLVMIHSSETLLRSNNDLPICVDPKVKVQFDVRVRGIVGTEATIDVGKTVTAQ